MVFLAALNDGTMARDASRGLDRHIVGISDRFSVSIIASYSWTLHCEPTKDPFLVLKTYITQSRYSTRLQPLLAYSIKPVISFITIYDGFGKLQIKAGCSNYNF